MKELHQQSRVVEDWAKEIEETLVGANILTKGQIEAHLPWLLKHIRKTLHQSRTELMRKVVGSMEGLKDSYYFDDLGNAKGIFNHADKRFFSLVHRALIKLAEEEGITIE